MSPRLPLILALSVIVLSINPALGSRNDVTNQFIVGFKPHVLHSEVEPALHRLASALSPVAQDGSFAPGLAAAAAAEEPFTVLRILSTGDAGAADATVQASSAAQASGPVVLVRLADPAAADLLRARDDVAFVLQDAVITAASEGLPATASPPVSTSSALPAGAANAGARRGKPPGTNNRSCAPVTGTTATAATPVKLRQPVPCGKGTTDTLTYQGRTCGRGLQSVRWMSATGPDGCTIKRQPSFIPSVIQEVFGDCGIAPAGLAVPGSLGMRVCPPVPAQLPPPVCPRLTPPASATLPSGVVQIEAFRAGSTANPFPPGQAKVVVGIMGSGIEDRPDDYLLASGRSWVGDDPESYMEDLHGSGTHNAGTVGANGEAIVGVAPGVPLFSLKVLSSSGVGFVSSVLAVAEWAAGPEAAFAGIKVLLVPLTAGVPGTDPAFADYKAIICGKMEQLEAAGVLVVAAAGSSFDDSFGWMLPAACPTVLVATGEPTINSKWLNASGMVSEEDAWRIVSAPGLNINSTFPRSMAATLASPERSGGYGTLNGTSVAASHVAGVAANCIASGACSAAGGPAAWRKLIVQAAIERKTSYSPSFGAAYNPKAGDRFYGYALWSKW